MERIREFKSKGYCLIKNFFSRSDLDGLLELKVVDNRAFPLFYSKSCFDCVTNDDVLQKSGLSKIGLYLNELMGIPMEFYNSFYVELDAKYKDKKGFPWHADIASFSILENDVAAVFSWIMCENSLKNGEGVLEILRNDVLQSHLDTDISGRTVCVLPTKELEKTYSIAKLSTCKYTILDTFTWKVITFLDEDLDDIKEKIDIHTGDLVIGNRDLIHRIKPLDKSNEGIRKAFTFRYFETGATYNGILDEGIHIFQYNVYQASKLWLYLKGKGRGYVINNMDDDR